jgi:HEAT repeat protein
MRKTLVVSLLWPAIAICQTSATPSTAAPAPVDRDRQCKDILEKALQDKNPDTRNQAAIALSLVGAVDPCPSELEALLDDKDVQVSVSVVASLSDPAVSGRATAALLLEKENDPQTLAALKEALAAKEWSVRAAAVHALVMRDEPAFQTDTIPCWTTKRRASAQAAGLEHATETTTVNLSEEAVP